MSESLFEALCQRQSMAARTTVGPSNPQTQIFTAFLMVLLMFFMGTSSLYTPQEVLSMKNCCEQ